MSIKLSILMLSVPNRIQSPMNDLYQKVLTQIGNRKDVELLCLIDNKIMSIGQKRNKLLHCASGTHLCFLDDDDGIFDDYVESLVENIEKNPNVDVISFKQFCTVNNIPFKVTFKLGNPHQPAILGSDGKYPDILRPPYHMCVWKSIIAKNTPFEDVSYGEDFYWIQKMCQRVKNSIFIDKVLHYYNYSDKTSESIKRK